MRKAKGPFQMPAKLGRAISVLLILNCGGWIMDGY